MSSHNQAIGKVPPRATKASEKAKKIYTSSPAPQYKLQGRDGTMTSSDRLVWKSGEMPGSGTRPLSAFHPKSDAPVRDARFASKRPTSASSNRNKYISKNAPVIATPMAVTGNYGGSGNPFQFIDEFYKSGTKDNIMRTASEGKLQPSSSDEVRMSVQLTNLKLQEKNDLLRKELLRLKRNRIDRDNRLSDQAENGASKETMSETVTVPVPKPATTSNKVTGTGSETCAPPPQQSNNSASVSSQKTLDTVHLSDSLSNSQSNSQFNSEQQMRKPVFPAAAGSATQAVRAAAATNAANHVNISLASSSETSEEGKDDEDEFLERLGKMQSRARPSTAHHVRKPEVKQTTTEIAATTATLGEGKEGGVNNTASPAQSTGSAMRRPLSAGARSASRADSSSLARYFELSSSRDSNTSSNKNIGSGDSAAKATAAAAAFLATATKVPAPAATVRPSSAHPASRATTSPATFSSHTATRDDDGSNSSSSADRERRQVAHQRPQSAAPSRRADTSESSKVPEYDEFDESSRSRQPLSQQQERERLQEMIRDRQWDGMGRPDCYVFGKLLGQGSFGTVRLAHHKITGHKVAVKSYERHKFKDEAQVKRCRQEIELMKTLNHVHIVRLFEVFETSKRIHLVMEAASGGNLCSYVKSRKRLPESEAVRIFYHLTLAIDYLHTNGIVHRDIKLENVLFDSNRVIKLVDFGFSVRSFDKPLKVFCGTPSYMAPEIVRRKEYVGFPVDVWSLGILLYAMLVGRFPFTAKTYPELYKKIARGVFQIPDGISTSVREALRRMLTLQPDERITIAEIKNQKILTERADTFPQVPSPNKCVHLISDDPNDDIVPSLVKQLTDFGFPRDRLIRSIQERHRSHFTTTYYLLAMKAEKKRLMQTKQKEAHDAPPSQTKESKFADE